MAKLGRPKTKTKKTTRTRITVTLRPDEKAKLKKIGGTVSGGITALLEKYQSVLFKAAPDANTEV
jgi:hypothetical protein